jgi:hypothetical protein
MIDRRFYRPFVMLLILATIGCSFCRRREKTLASI